MYILPIRNITLISGVDGKVDRVAFGVGRPFKRSAGLKVCYVTSIHITNIFCRHEKKFAYAETSIC